MINKILRISTLAVLWFLVALATLILFIFVPFLTTALVGSYEEYFGDAVLIQTLLSLPVALAILLLVTILGLLRSIRIGTIYSQSAQSKSRMLVLFAGAMSLAFLGLMTWLISKNTMPPSLFAFLIIATLVSLAVALVTANLQALLRDASTAKLELEGVI